MSDDDSDPGEPNWVRLSNAALFLLSLLVVVPVGLLAWVMISLVIEPLYSGPSVAQGWLLVWALAASVVAGVHLVASAIGISRPKRAKTLRMLTASAFILVTCPLLWSWGFGVL